MSIKINEEIEIIFTSDGKNKMNDNDARGRVSSISNGNVAIRFPNGTELKVKESEIKNIEERWQVIKQISTDPSKV